MNTNNVITINQDLFDSLYKYKEDVAKYEEEHKKIAKKKEQRALSYKRSRKVSPDEKKFGATLRAASRTFKAQVYQDSATLRHTIKRKIKPVDQFKFYSLFVKRLKAIKGLKNFEAICKNKCADPDAAAQRIVIRGEKAMNSVFKNGLDSIFEDAELEQMQQVVFEEKDLELTQYLMAHEEAEN